MTKEILFALLTVPLLLLITLTVYQNFFSSSQTVFETNITNETLGTGPGTYTSAFPAKVGSAIIYNGTTVCPAAVCSIDYRSGLYPAIVSVGSGAGSVSIRMSYIGYTREGYTQYVRTYTGTQSGFNLASLLPFILIAIAIVAVIVGALLR